MNLRLTTTLFIVISESPHGKIPEWWPQELGVEDELPTGNSSHVTSSAVRWADGSRRITGHVSDT